MDDHSVRLHNGRTGSAITVQVIPGTSRTEIREVLGDGTIKIALGVPKSDPKANEHLINFLAKILHAHASKIEIVAGISGWDKLITILDMDTATVHERIYKQLS